MCPICVSTAALIAASLTTSGGLVAIAIRKFNVRAVETGTLVQTSSKEDQHG
jgi:hypothetical protein